MEFDNLTLAEIVTSNPSAARVFENFNLDFCCRGKQKLSEVLSNDQIKLKEVKDSLELISNKKTDSEINFNNLSLTELVDYILNHHHNYVKENLPVIQNHLEKVVLKHGDAFPEMIKIKQWFEEIKRELEQHMMKEEVILFPRIKLIESIKLNGLNSNKSIAIEGPVFMMQFEHENAGNIMAEIKKLSNDFSVPPHVCNTFNLVIRELKIFDSDLHCHVHLENNILFPKALQMLSELPHHALKS